MTEFLNLYLEMMLTSKSSQFRNVEMNEFELEIAFCYLFEDNVDEFVELFIDAGRNNHKIVLPESYAQ